MCFGNNNGLRVVHLQSCPECHLQHFNLYIGFFHSSTCEFLEIFLSPVYNGVEIIYLSSFNGYFFVVEFAAVVAKAQKSLNVQWMA